MCLVTASLDRCPKKVPDQMGRPNPRCRLQRAVPAYSFENGLVFALAIKYSMDRLSQRHHQVGNRPVCTAPYHIEQPEYTDIARPTTSSDPRQRCHGTELRPRWSSSTGPWHRITAVCSCGARKSDTEAARSSRPFSFVSRKMKLSRNHTAKAQGESEKNKIINFEIKEGACR